MSLWQHRRRSLQMEVKVTWQAQAATGSQQRVSDRVDGRRTRQSLNQQRTRVTVIRAITSRSTAPSAGGEGLDSGTASRQQTERYTWLWTSGVEHHPAITRVEQQQVPVSPSSRPTRGNRVTSSYHFARDGDPD